MRAHFDAEEKVYPMVPPGRGKYRDGGGISHAETIT